MPFVLTDKSLSYLIVKYPRNQNGDTEEQKYIRFPIPLTPISDITTRISGLLETGVTLLDNIPTNQISSTLGNASKISEAEIKISKSSTFTYQTKGQGDLQLNITSAIKNKLDFILDGLIEKANNTLISLRFTYIGTRAFKPNLYLVNRSKPSIAPNTQYTFTFRQPERGIGFATPRQTTISTIK